MLQYRMANQAARTLRRFMAVQALSFVSAAIIILGQYVYLPSAVLAPFTATATFLITGFAFTWAIEGAALWDMSRIKILVWSLLLSFGLNFPILFILNLTVGMIIWPIILCELISALGFSAIGYMRERKAQVGFEGAEAKSRCQNCGSPIGPEQTFCPNCGVSLRGKPESIGTEDELT